MQCSSPPNPPRQQSGSRACKKDIKIPGHVLEPRGPPVSKVGLRVSHPHQGENYWCDTFALAECGIHTDKEKPISGGD